MSNETLENTDRVWDDRLICGHCKRKFATCFSIGNHMHGGYCHDLEMARTNRELERLNQIINAYDSV